MINVVRLTPDLEHAISRLAALAELDGFARQALHRAIERGRRVKPRRELVAEGDACPAPLLMVEGWAARVRMLPDGRRQIVNFVLPGDLIGRSGHPRPLAMSTVVALTEVIVCPAPPAEAYAFSDAHGEAHLLGAITRLGRLNALERLQDLLLELFERLGLAGLTVGNGFTLPVTQDMLADALGLTSVHVNRTLQLCRSEGILTLKSGHLELRDPARLAAAIGRTPIRMSAHRD